GIGDGQGGSLKITSTSPEEFTIGSAFFFLKNGVDGDISVNGSGAGQGGQVDITAKGSVIDSIFIGSFINARGGSTGSGGSISLTSTNDRLQIRGFTPKLDAGGGTTTTGKGGNITLSGRDVTLQSSSLINVAPLRGAGGEIHILANGGTFTTTGGQLGSTTCCTNGGADGI